MKKRLNGILTVCGCVLIALSLILFGLSLYGHSISKEGAEGEYQSVLSQRKLWDKHLTVSSKTAPSAIKKAAAAVSAIETLKKDADKYTQQAEKLLASYNDGASDDPLLEAVYAAEAQLANDDPLYESLSASAETHVLKQLTDSYSAAVKSLRSAESKLDTAVKGLNDIYSGSGLDSAGFSYEKFSEQAINTPAESTAAFEALNMAVIKLGDATNELNGLCAQAQLDAEAVCKADKLADSKTVLYIIGTYPIGLFFTACVLLITGLVLVFLKHGFIRLWNSSAVFSTFVALVVMLIIQVYALGFGYDSMGAWASQWLTNILNVLRSNASNGMIALGMTFVIITGGIDLAVGSNLAGVATIVMALIDTSDKGILIRLGLSGWPAFCVAIAGGMLAGMLLGILTGVGITKGHIPPFIITLGIMNIVRSLAQYFTKSYKPKVPAAFQAIANTEVIGGQMLLPVIYWLILALIMFLISRYTAFGRHIYAVGSNEKTSRLSGINTDNVKIAVYSIMGLIVALTAVMQVARLGSIDVASAGSGYEMNAIAAVVVGGTSMAGGKGSIIGTVLGVLIIGIMNNLLVLLGIDVFLTNAFTGAIIIFAVLIQKKDK